MRISRRVRKGWTLFAAPLVHALRRGVECADEAALNALTHPERGRTVALRRPLHLGVGAETGPNIWG